MVSHTDLTASSLAERLTLLGVTYLSVRDETPAHTGQVVSICTWEFDEVDADVLGTLSEADVSRALNGLEADGVVEQALGDESSPVGKGRPRYSLSVDPDAVLESYATDDRLTALVEYIRETQ